MSLRTLIFGEPLATSQEGEQRVGWVAGIPMLGLDALASAAYGPEAAMTLLIPLGALGIGYVAPITTVITALLAMVYVSYLQTIAAYPAGGGSYTVARVNLGERQGLLAAAALLLDYVLVVAVGISACVGALVSALPVLQPADSWSQRVEAPARAARLPVPRLVPLMSPYRHVFNPLLTYILQTKQQHPDRQIAVLIPELVARRWYQHFLHNKRAAMLKTLLLLRGDEDIVVINVPWYLES